MTLGFVCFKIRKKSQVQIVTSRAPSTLAIQKFKIFYVTTPLTDYKLCVDNRPRQALSRIDEIVRNSEIQVFQTFSTALCKEIRQSNSPMRRYATELAAPLTAVGIFYEE